MGWTREVPELEWVTRRACDAPWAQAHLLNEVDTAVLGCTGNIFSRFTLGRQKATDVAVSADVVVDMVTEH